MFGFILIQYFGFYSYVYFLVHSSLVLVLFIPLEELIRIINRR